MDEFRGSDELRFLDPREGPSLRLSRLARRLGALPEDADPTLGEWEEALIGLRRALFGPRIAAELTCPACGGGIAAVFGADELPRAEPAPPPPGLRAMRLSDLLAVEAAPEGPGGRLALLLARLSGSTPEEAAARLSGPEGPALALALERLAAGLDLTLGTACAECGEAIALPFDVAAFVAAEIAEGARGLLDEVHVLARAYHWSEAEILGLPRERRRAYLSRIERDRLGRELRHG